MNFIPFEKSTVKQDYKIYPQHVNGIHYDGGPELQLIYVIEGSVYLEVSGKEITGREGDLLVLNMCQSKFVYSNTNQNLCLILSISADYLRGLGDVYTEVRIDNHIGRDRLKDTTRDLLLGVYKLNMDKAGEGKTLAKINKLLLELIKNYRNIDEYIFGMEEKRSYLYNIQDIIASGEIQNLKLKYLSNKLHLSQSYISKIFNEVVGVQFTEYVQQLKLYYSCMYIVQTTKTLEEIAGLVGFESTKSLNRIFGKYLDVKPSEYRNKYREFARKTEYSHKFEELLKNIEKTSYSDYIRNYYGEDLEFELDIKEEGRKLPKSWSVIRNFKSLGNDFLAALKDLESNVNISEIIIRFKMKRGEKALYLADLDREISQDELYTLLYKCMEKEIVGVISLDLGERKSVENIEEKLDYHKYFYDLIGRAIGTTNMKRFKYLINIENIGNYVEDDQALEKYRSYLEEQQLILEDKMNTADFVWGFEIGEISDEKLDDLRRVYEKLYKLKYKFVPSFMSLAYNDPEISIVNTIEELQVVEQDLVRKLKKIEEIRAIADFPGDMAYVRGLFRHIDISGVDYSYRELFMLSLMARVSFLFKGELKYITDFIVKDDREESGYYHPRYIDNHGFYTPIYWSLRIMNMLRGEVICNEDGIFATKDGRDIYVLVYGNIILNHFYGASKYYSKLWEEKYSLNLRIKGLEGKYKITTDELSYKHGNVNYHLGNSENYSYLSLSEKKQIQSLSIPKFTIDIREISGEIRDDIDYAPFSFILRKYIRV